MKLQDYVEIGQTTQLADLKSRLMDFAERFDFRWVGAVLVVENAPGEPRFKSVGSYPSRFTALKDPSIARVDPVLARLRTQGLPFVYDQQFYVDADAAPLWEHAAPFGYRTGISAALRISKRRQLLLGMDREDPLPIEEAQVARMLADLQMLAVHCADATARILDPDGEGALQLSDVVLTPREKEVLKWTENGLKAFAVGEKLNISERMVIKHLQNAMRKLDCSSKYMAASKATRLGLL